MKILIDNKDNINLTEVSEETIRVKAIIVNDKSEILLGYSFGAYQFPGGHVEKGEELNESLHRELLEETGMDIDTSELKPFMFLEHIDKDPEFGNKCLTKIYYYIVNTEEEIDLSKTQYTLEETIGNYELRLIPLNLVENILLKNSEVAPENKVMATEMLEAIKEYKKLSINKV